MKPSMFKRQIRLLKERIQRLEKRMSEEKELNPMEMNSIMFEIFEAKNKIDDLMTRDSVADEAYRKRRLEAEADALMEI